MAHRLRRVIAINIRNASTKAASQQIAMLDLRAHTMVVGDNGVGKSSFMRLIPLFYGAAPERILRGTQKSSLIGYTLPAPSSAIAFEYERESEQDLHLVVVHAKPGVEQAEFYIVPTGYREDYFVDQQNLFVERDQFKRRLEDMGIEVSPRLQLHQYRSVILNERRSTKDGQEMRTLAARHALGPRSLFGLDMIAVAMTGERMAFRDLQNLVLDRLSDTGYEGLRGGNAKALRKDRRDIDGWLANVRHAHRVFGEQEKVKRMRDLIVDVRKIALELGSLRSATERSIKGLLAALEAIRNDLNALEEKVQRFEQESSARRLEFVEAESSAKEAWTLAKDALEGLTRQQKSFEVLQAPRLAEQQDQENQIRHECDRASQELQHMEALAGEAGKALKERLAEIDHAVAIRLQEIDAERGSGNEAHSAALGELEAQREVALVAFEAKGPPLRVAELDALIVELRDRRADHKAQAVLAEAPQAAQDNLKQAEGALAKAVANLDQRAGACSDARDALGKVENESKSLVFELDRAEAEALAARERHGLLSEQLSPPPGSVLEALRAQPLELWQGAAKVLEPALLLRKDLQPHVAHVESALLDGGAPGSAGLAEAGAHVQVGSLNLQVDPVDLPSWAREDSARAHLQAASKVLEAADKALEELRSRSKTLRGTLRDAQDQLRIAEAGHAGAKTTRAEADAILDRARKHIEVERKRVRGEHARQVDEAQRRIQSLEGEQVQLKVAHAAARAAIEKQFSEQRGSLNNANTILLNRLGLEKDSAAAAAQAEKERAQAQHDHALAGKGVDAKALADLHERVQRLDAILRDIATHRHTVHAWHDFRRKDLPRLPQAQRDEKEALQRKDGAESQLRTHDREVLEQRASLQKQVVNLQSRQNKDQEELGQLQRLLADLQPFREVGRLDLSEGLYVDLKASAQREKASLDSRTVSLVQVTRAVSDVMRERPGAIANWLDNHEAERDRALIDKTQMLEFELACWRAQTVSDWFEPLTHRDHLISLRQEMDGYLAAADAFVSEIDRFEERVKGLHNEFLGALRRTAGFQRFGELEIGISSTASNSPAVKALRQMKDVSQSKVSSWRTSMAADAKLPDAEEVQLIQGFKEHLPDGGVLQVNLDEQVRLTFRVTEMGKAHDIQNERDMQGLSSTGLTVLITMMFLIGFVGIVRGPGSPVGLAWVLDEVGRVSPTNMVKYLEVLAQQGITAVCAAPSIDPALGALFETIHMFEDDGSISRPDDAGADVGALALAPAGTQEVLQ